MSKVKSLNLARFALTLVLMGLGSFALAQSSGPLRIEITDADVDLPLL